jgi:O-antigen/teichoic acid export membrane protein
MMGKMCGGIMGVLILVAGVGMLGYLGAGLAWVPGAAFVLVGLCKLAHLGGMCPSCKVK